MGSGVKNRVGTVIGTGAAIDVRTVGFRPSYVKIMNVTGNCLAEWTAEMADASAQKIVDSGAGTTDVSLITSNGITPLSDGFRIGADADLNVAAEVIRWVALE